VRLQLNSLGTPAARAAYRETLVAYFRQHESALDDDSRRRLVGNPLRILDSKNADMRALIQDAPLLPDFLDDESKQHFAQLRASLDDCGIPYEVNPRLVRGLDYYSRTVFEWTTDALGAQDAVCSGGRYDGLVGLLGGESTPGIGCALGMERVVELMGAVPPPSPPQVYVIVAGTAAERSALALAETLRGRPEAWRVHVNLGGGSIKTQFRRADQSGAQLALILGDAEIERGVVAVKPLRAEGGQSEIPLVDAVTRLSGLLTMTGE
jgi:histidyl-tRNA synthetase